MFALGSFEIHRQVAEPLVAKNVREGIAADLPAADVLVPIDPRTKFAFAVIEMHRRESVDANHAVEFAECGEEVASFGERIAGGEGMARVEAHAQSIGRVDSPNHLRQLFETPSQARTLAGRVFQQDAGANPRQGPVDLIQSANNVFHRLLVRAAGRRAWMQHHAADSQFLGAAQLQLQRPHRAFPNRRLRAAQVDQVRAMSDWPGDF